MSKLISRDDTVKALSDAMPIMKSPDGSHPADEAIFAAQEAFADAIHIVSGMPEADNWIPVEKGMPEGNVKNDHSKDVLVYVPQREGVKQHGIYIGCLHEVAGDEKGERNIWGLPTERSSWTLWGWSYFEHPVVAAWMPMPEAYKGGKGKDG